MYPISTTGIPFTLRFQIECKYQHHDVSKHQNWRYFIQTNFVFNFRSLRLPDSVFFNLSETTSATLVLFLLFLALVPFFFASQVLKLLELGLELVGLAPLIAFLIHNIP
jgi:hypothetical protein